MKMKNKEHYFLIILCVLAFLASVHKYFYHTGIRWDIFLFYDYETPSGCKGKLASGITYELAYMIQVSALLIFWKRSIYSVSLKNIISPFIWISLLDILDYLAVYKQLSYWKLPLLIVLVVYFNFFRGKKAKSLWKRFKNIWKEH